MSDIDLDYSEESTQPNVPNSSSPPAGAKSDEKPDVDTKRTANVQRWIKQIKAAKDIHEPAFKRMRKCQDLAKDGADKKWIRNEDNYTAPILNRHINTQVGLLYAKDPKPLAKRKNRMLNTVWDGNITSLKDAIASVESALQQAQQFQAAMMGMQPAMQQAGPVPGMPPAPGMPPTAMPPSMPLPPAPPDPSAIAIINDAIQVRQQEELYDKMGKTLEYLYSYYMGEQSSNYKSELKALVRRVKVCGVGYIKLGFQRVLQPRPEVMAQISDCTSQIAHFEALKQQLKDGDIDDVSAKLDELKLLEQQLQDQSNLIVREGPVLDFPKATEIIVDPETRHLKTLAGCGWYAHEFDMTPEQVMETFKVDIGSNYVQYDSGDRVSARVKKSQKETKSKGKVWLVQDGKNRQEFVVCDGYPDFIVEPKEPDVRVERFYNLFPVVFNEIEHDEEMFPPSDVWLARHAQAEYNRARNGLREHRQQNRPYYVVSKGKLEEEDKARLGAHDSGEVIEIAGLAPGEKAADMLQAGPVVAINPINYDVEAIYNDIMRVVGSSEAALGNPGDQTATATQIAETSRQTTAGDNVDDLDAAMSELANAMGQLMLIELSKDTVVEIVGPGAVWPDMPLTRQEISKDLFLDVKAGSMGRPNKAMELANLERAMPYIMQLPGMNPTPFAEKLADLLDIDLQHAVLEGLPSIVAVNAMMAKLGVAPGASGGMPQPGTGNPQSDPNAQGGQGADNAPAQPGASPMATPLPQSGGAAANPGMPLM